MTKRWWGMAVLWCLWPAVALCQPATVTLAWDAPAPSSTGAILAGYRLYRYEHGSTYAEPPVCTTLPAALCCENIITTPGVFTYVVVADYGTAGMSAPSNAVVVGVGGQWLPPLIGLLLP